MAGAVLEKDIFENCRQRAKNAATMAPRSLLSLGILSTRALVAVGFAPPIQRINSSRSLMIQSVANEQSSTSSASTLPSFVGGDFAGLSATFSPTTGEFIPVPEYLVPDVLLEWGQGPSCLEVIVSEDVDDKKLTRTSVTVVPDVGCGIDNLDTIKSQHEIDLATSKVFDNTVAVYDYTLPNKTTRHETLFAIENGQRMRVMVDIMQDNFQVKSPIILVLERRTSFGSSRGTIADGGGLDGRTVSNLLGDLAKGKPFAELEPVEWDAAKDEENTIFLKLPGNVTISYTLQSDPAVFLEVGHVEDGAMRRVVRRSLNANGTTKDMQYSTETKS